MFEKEVDELKINLDKALYYREKEEYKLAIEALYKALDVQSDNVDVLVQLAEIYAILKDFERSIKYYKAILEIQPQNLLVLNSLYSLCFSLGKYKDALEIALLALSFEKNDKNYFNLVKIYDKFSDIKALRELVLTNPLSDDVLLFIAEVYVKHAFANDAVLLLDKLPSCEEKNVLLALIAFNNNDMEKAKSIIMPVNVENAIAYNLKGLFYIEDMKFIDAIKCFSKAVLLDPTDAKLYFNLANAYFHNGWFDEAIEAFKKAIELDVTNVDYRCALANLYFEKKDFNKAKQEVVNIRHIDGEHVDTNILVALLKYTDKDYLGAKEDLENILVKLPENNFVKSSLAKVLIDLKYFAKAEDLILDVIAKDKNSLNSQCVLADLFVAQDKCSEALELVDRLLVENKFYMPAYEVCMKAALGLANYDLVQIYAQQAISIDINFAVGYYYLALVRKNQNDFEEAVECLKRAIMYDLTNPEYYAEMARIYLELDEVKSALDYANEAISIDGSSTQYMLLYSEIAKLNRKICQ